MPPRRGRRLPVADEALLHHAQFVMIGPIPAAIAIGSGQNLDLRAVDEVGHKVGLTIGLSDLHTSIMSQIEVLSAARIPGDRRRHWSDDEKLRMVDESNIGARGMVAATARRHEHLPVHC